MSARNGPGNEAAGTWALAWRLLRDGGRGEAGRTALGLMLVVLSSLVGLLQPWPLKLVLDSVLGSHPLPPLLAGTLLTPAGRRHLLLLLCLAQLGLQVLAGLLTVLQTSVLVSVGLRMVFKLRCAVFDHVQQLSLAFHDASSVGDSLYRIVWGTYCVQTLFNGGLVPAITATVMLVGVTGIMWSLDRGMTLAALVVCVPLIVLIRRMDRPMNASSERVQERESEVSTRTQETLTGIRAVQAFGQQEFESARFRRGAQAVLRASLKLTVLQAGSQAAVQALLAAGTSALLWIGAARVLQGRLTPGDVVLLLSYLGMLYKPLETLAYMAATVQSAAAGGRRVYAVLDAAPDVRDAPKARDLPARARGHLTLRRLSFAYRAGQRVLRDVDLDFPPGRSVALVGASGAGKTTLASLLLRFYDPTEGEVQLDGHDVRDLTLRSLRSQIALVPQEPVLFNASVSENIAYARPDALDEEIQAAARAAGAHDFIAALPNGYDTQIGERGVSLSGGQRQRLSIARAFLKDAPVLIMDEPTSALDTETESRLVASLRALMQGRTTVIIAHRLSTIRHVDHIIVLRDGEVVEQGTFDELRRQGGPFQRLYDLQFSPAVPPPQPAVGGQKP